jgi:hypothetical protein
MVFLLLQLYDDLDRISGLGGSKQKYLDHAFSEAIDYDSSAAIGLLIDAGADTNQYTIPCREESCEAPCYRLDFLNTQTGTLARAVSFGHSATVKILLERGALVNGLSTVDLADCGTHDDLEPPLNVAIRCFSGRQLISLLLKYGADANRSFRDVRPLALAIHHSSKPPEEPR